MTRFVLLTKTRWEEPPRIRHQLAQLLAGAGHEVLFFQKPARPGDRIKPPFAAAAGITVAQHREFLHHKLRLLPALHRLNAAVVARSLRRILRDCGFGADSVVLNFNYDYWFLRDLFPGQRVITMINDDFVSTAPLGFQWPMRWALARTCRDSDKVLTVSEPLRQRLAPYCNAELFLPWADRAYQAPPDTGTRNLLLFWGFINNKIDFARVQALATELAAARPSLRIMMVGPLEQGVDAQLDALRANANVEVLPATALDELPMPRVLAALIPYRDGVEEITAIALPNKALQLLARGVPLLISGMPNFIDEPFVFRLGEADAAVLTDRISAGFAALQPVMQAFVTRNSGPARLAQFLQLAA